MGAAGHRWTEIAERAWCGGATSAPQLAVVGGMHGDEPVGARLVEALRDDLDPDALGWQLRLLVGNPRALAAGVRSDPLLFDPYDGENPRNHPG